jgi:hypothetical protein
VWSLEIQIMINAIHADVLAIKNALLKLPAQKSFGKRLFRYKSCTLILKPALLILKCSLTPDTSGCQVLTARNLSSRASCYGRTRFLMTLPLLPHISKQRIFKVLVNNKYKQLNIRTMAESFEGKILVTHWQIFAHRKCSAVRQVGIRVIFNHCKRLRCYGMYTHEWKNQANDFNQDLLQKRTRLGLMVWQQQKAAHNTMMRAKDAARIPSATVPGMTSTNRVYDPVAPVAQTR